MKVDIDWEDKENRVLKARLYSGKKRKSGFRFKILTNIQPVNCSICPFINNICLKYKTIHLCSKLWDLDGNNNFEGRGEEVMIFSPVPFDYVIHREQSDSK